MTVQEMIDKLSNMPRSAQLKIEVYAYYWDGDDFQSLEEPILNEDGTVTIGKVCASP